MPENKTWEVPVTWTENGTMRIQAETLDEAIEKAIGEEPLPKDADYVADSCEVDYDNLNQEQN